MNPKNYYPEAHVPLIDPPLSAHSLEKKRRVSYVFDSGTGIETPTRKCDKFHSYNLYFHLTVNLYSDKDRS